MTHQPLSRDTTQRAYNVNRTVKSSTHACVQTLPHQTLQGLNPLTSVYATTTQYPRVAQHVSQPGSWALGISALHAKTRRVQGRWGHNIKDTHHPSHTHTTHTHTHTHTHAESRFGTLLGAQRGLDFLVCLDAAIGQISAAKSTEASSFAKEKPQRLNGCLSVDLSVCLSASHVHPNTHTHTHSHIHRRARMRKTDLH